jgi:hypothetical protein
MLVKFMLRNGKEFTNVKIVYSFGRIQALTLKAN